MIEDFEIFGDYCEKQMGVGHGLLNVISALGAS
jgi:hypothetical protein